MQCSDTIHRSPNSSRICPHFSYTPTLCPRWGSAWLEVPQVLYMRSQMLGVHMCSRLVSRNHGFTAVIHRLWPLPSVYPLVINHPGISGGIPTAAFQGYNHHLLAHFPTFRSSSDPSLLPTRDPQAIPHSNETQIGYPHSLSQHHLVMLPQSPIATGQGPPPPPSPLQGLDSSQPPHKEFVSYYLWLGNLHSGFREVLTAD